MSSGQLPLPDVRGIGSQLQKGDLNAVLTRYSDLLLIGIMIVPVPTFALDLLIATNITIAITVLMISLYVPNALALASFPSILLVATLFRAALNVSSTRLILLNADAGAIIRSFGQFVVQNDYVVGFVVFLIITIIQFVVIAKGAERVAEVAARFTLDGLPGKQMSIDADLRAGIIDADEARRRRDLLARESQFYGAMDGAMKFVKGDAIAGIAISVINICAGLGIGVLARGLPVGEAARKYTLLTVGDGLVSQIPSLIIATAAGIITTRVVSNPGEESSLGREIGVQILAQPKAIAIAAGLLFIFGLIPGLPFLPFTTLALASGGLAWGVIRTRAKKDMEAIRAEVMGPDALAEGGPQARLPMAVPVILEAGANVTPLVDVQIDGTRLIQELVPQMREWLFSDLGVHVPGVRVRGEAGHLPEDGYQILVNEVPVASGNVYKDRVFVTQSLGQADRMAVDRIEASHPESGEAGLWIPLVDADRLGVQPTGSIAPDEFIAIHLAHMLREHIDQLVGIQDVQNILDLMETQGFGALVRNVVPGLVPVPRLTEIVRRLLGENISIRNMRTILEALATWATYENDTTYLTEYVRIALKDYIGHRFATQPGQLSAYLLDPQVEESIRGGIRQSASGTSLALDPDVKQALLDAFAAAFADRPEDAGDLCILTQMEVRWFVRNLLEYEYPRLSVVSYQELPASLKIVPAGRVTLHPTLPEGAAVGEP